MSLKVKLNVQLQKNIAIADTVGEQLNDLFAVRDYMLRRINQTDLTPTQQKKLELYEFAYNQLIGGKWSESEVIDLIITKSGIKQKPLAVQVLNDTKELFTTVLSVHKQWELKKQLHLNENLLRKAEMSGDYRSAAAFAKNMIAITDRIETIENEQEEFKGHTLVVSADPSIIGVEPAKAKDVQKLLNDLKEKYDYEDADIITEENGE